MRFFPFWFFFFFPLFLRIAWLLTEVKTQWRDCRFAVTERVLFKEMYLYVTVTGSEIWWLVCVTHCGQNVCFLPVQYSTVQCSAVLLVWFFIFFNFFLTQWFSYNLREFCMGSALLWFKHFFKIFMWMWLDVHAAYLTLTEEVCVFVCVCVMQVVNVIDVLWSGKHNARTLLPCHSTQPCWQHTEPHLVINYS